VGRTDNTKTPVVVPVVGLIPVAVGGTRILWMVVPGAAAQHPLRADRVAPPVTRQFHDSKKIASNPARRYQWALIQCSVVQ
jgi:hypothetical protein